MAVRTAGACMVKKYIKNKFLAEAAEWIIAIAGMLALLLIIRNFVFRSATVNSQSMEPTLYHGEKVIILKFPYLFGHPKAGDIIAFPYKTNPSQFFVKRIIGEPGDVINIADRRFTVNGAEIDDEFSDELLISLGDAVFPITVPDRSYFVLGDNRNSSNDSRFTGVGCIFEGDIIGKVVIRYWPLNKFAAVK